MKRRLVAVWIVFTVACFFGNTFIQAEPSVPPAITEPTADLASEFVSMAIPSEVRAGEQFGVMITMRNTGRIVWQLGNEGVVVELVSQNPENNTVWGTNFIILGQGRSCKPGETFTFASNLKAPWDPGRYSFQWRMSQAVSTVRAGPRDTFFGHVTDKAFIEVVAREDVERQPASIPAPKDDGKKALTYEDFRYIGSYRVPANVDGARSAYSRIGMTMRKTSEGERRLILNYTHPQQVLVEIEMPELIKLEGPDVSGLNIPEVKTTWGAIQKPVEDRNKLAFALGDIYWDDNDQLLYWTWSHAYWTGPIVPSLGATKLGDNGQAETIAVWKAPNMKYHWGGVTRLSDEFAQQYTGGRTLALGFGGYYSICGPASRGPALGAIAKPDTEKDSVDLLPLLGHPGDAPATRNGDYFNANCSYWNDPPESEDVGFWTFKDHCFSGVFVDVPTHHAFIVFPRIGTGRLGYDYGRVTAAGESQYWYFYNPDDLGAVAQGKRERSKVDPYLQVKDTGGEDGPGLIGGDLTGSYFDPEQKRLYLLRVQTLPVRRKSQPVIHVYEIKPVENEVP